MAYISFQPSDYFNTILYTDNASNRTLTGVGFQPDFVWIKTRNHTNSHNLFNSVRGANKVLRSNLTNAELTTTDTLTAFTSDGFSLGVDASGYGVNYDNKNEVAWNWRAGNSSGSTNNDGSITSTVSANTTAGFSIVKYSGDHGTTTIGHGLGAVPKVIITKCLTTTHNWGMYHHSLGIDKYLRLDTTDSEQSSSGAWLSTPTSSVFGVGGLNENDQASQDYIAYCFAPVRGFSHFGKYDGSSNTDGPFIYTGFKPAWIMVKRTDSGSEDWNMWDNKRIGYNVSGNDKLYANLTSVESTGSDEIDILSNGFKWRTTNGGLNNSSGTYIYMAFAEAPLVASNGVPVTAK